MIYLISQVTFIFLTQIYYNFVTSLSNFITRFPWHFVINLSQLLLEDYFLYHAKMHTLEYIWKTCIKELRNFLKWRETFEKVLAACNSSQNTGLPWFFLKVFWRLYFLTKTKRCLLCWHLWIKNYQINWSF